jgi:hypothetical protein
MFSGFPNVYDVPKHRKHAQAIFSGFPEKQNIPKYSRQAQPMFPGFLGVKRNN